MVLSTVQQKRAKVNINYFYTKENDLNLLTFQSSQYILNLIRKSITLCEQATNSFP